MNEIFPVLAGAAVGAGVLRLAAGRLRVAALVALCVLVGLAASAISGELELSWGFVPVDVAEALVAGSLTMGLMLAWQRGTARTR
ncbi:MAG TPA: hypothetical protein VKV26_10810 [Dehalococcoidia bacterium]|nr:hypothetical protein [Dehalococcoidia bacterium]